MNAPLAKNTKTVPQLAFMLGLTIRDFQNEDGTVDAEKMSIRGRVGVLSAFLALTALVPVGAVAGATYTWLHFNRVDAATLTVEVPQIDFTPSAAKLAREAAQAAAMAQADAEMAVAGDDFEGEGECAC